MKPYDNPFWDFNNGGENNKKSKEKDQGGLKSARRPLKMYHHKYIFFKVSLETILIQVMDIYFYYGYFGNFNYKSIY